jgi:hypothetical protein
MKEFKVEYIVEAIGKIEKDAEKRKKDAGWGGRMDDGGASELLEKLEIFETMWDGKPLAESRVPKFIKSILIGVERLYDPEYQKYLELKAKFEENN